MLKQVKLLLCIVLLLYIVSCGKKEAPPVSQFMKQQISLLPADAELMGYMNVGAVQKSDIYKMFVDSLGVNPLDPKTYLKRVNLNLDQVNVKIEELFFASHLQKNGAMAPFIAAHGNMNLADYLTAFKVKTRDFVISEDKDFSAAKLFVIAAKDTFGVGFQDSTTMVVGNLEKVKSWFNHLQQKTYSHNAERINRLAALKQTKSVWFLTDAVSLLKTIKPIQTLKNVEGVQNIKSADISLDMDQNVALHSIIRTSDSENAALIKDALKGALASAKLSKSDDRDVTDAINKIKITQDDNRININAKISRKDIKIITRMQG